MEVKHRLTKNSFLGRFKVGSKITIGYFIALGIAVTGTSTGLLVGEYTQSESLQLAAITHEELELLHQLQTAVLQSRTHQQQLIPLAENPNDFKEEYEHILKHAVTIRKIWSDLNLFSQRYPNDAKFNTAKLDRFLLNYQEIPEKYLKELDMLVNQIQAQDLKNDIEVGIAQRQLLQFTNSDLALKFDGISDDLVQLVAKSYILAKDAESAAQEANSFRLWLIIVALASSIMLAGLMALLVSKAITQPLKNLTNVAKQITSKSDFNLRAPVISDDEVGILAVSLNQLMIRVNELLLDNQNRTKSLEEANEKLISTQEQLIVQEKMAALGSLTAGIAHEINTPLGIGVSAASLLSEKTRVLSAAYHDGTMKRSDLDNYLDIATQSNTMLMGNLQRAAELVQSFKQVAIDQSSEEARTFNIKEYLQGILIQLHPKLKQTKHKVEINGVEEIFITSYPGAFSQIITNLIVNSLIHAYEPEDSGLIVISYHQQVSSNYLILEYADDGKGIEKENLQKIFDPFFTTKRNQGGSGLGLHILFNIVNQKLLGTIDCESKLGLGTKFTIKIPLE
ncbi:MAG: HAMP domain-containing sensor histidine kinase [Cyanobacteria bacterium J06633_8]